MVTAESFRQAHEHDIFRHSAELLAGLQSGECRLHSQHEGGDCKELLGIYRSRARHLRSFESAHAGELLADILELCRNLETTKCPRCIMWLFELPRGRGMLVVEEDRSRKVLGCLKTVSKLGVTADEWGKLWGKAPEK